MGRTLLKGLVSLKHVLFLFWNSLFSLMTNFCMEIVIRNGKNIFFVLRLFCRKTIIIYTKNVCQNVIAKKTFLIINWAKTEKKIDKKRGKTHTLYRESIRALTLFLLSGLWNISYPRNVMGSLQWNYMRHCKL